MSDTLKNAIKERIKDNTLRIELLYKHIGSRGVASTQIIKINMLEEFIKSDKQILKDHGGKKTS